MGNYKDGLEVMQSLEDYRKNAPAFSYGNEQYNWNKIKKYVNILFDHFAPFKIGDKVKITEGAIRGAYNEQPYINTLSIYEIDQADCEELEGKPFFSYWLIAKDGSNRNRLFYVTQNNLIKI